MNIAGSRRPTSALTVDYADVLAQAVKNERWRVILCAVFLAALLVPFLMPKAPYKGLNAALLFIAKKAGLVS